jgi:hypothetical protein
MAIYKVATPDGTVHRFEGPDGLSPDRVTTLAQEQLIIPPEPKRDYTLGEISSKAFGRGVERVKSTLGDVLPAMGASVLGFDDYAKKQMEEAARSEEFIQRTMAPQYPSYKDVEGVGDAGKFALETTLEQIANLFTVLVPGGAGGVAGRLAAKKVAAGTVKELTEQEAKKQLSKTASARAAKKIQDSITKGQTIGQASGVFLGSYALNAPEVFQNIYDQTGTFEPGAASIAGIINASLDSIFPTSILKAFSKPGRAGVVTKILEKSGMQPTLARRATANVLGGLGTEGLTEATQEAVSIAAEKFVQSHDFIFDSDDFDRMLESGIRGAVAGGVFRGVSAIPEHLREKALTEKAPKEKQEEAKKQDAAVETAATPATTLNENLEQKEIEKQAANVLDLQANQEKLQKELDLKLQTPEGITEVAEKRLTEFFQGYDKKELNVIRKDLKKLRTELEKDTALKNAAKTDAKNEQNRQALINKVTPESFVVTDAMLDKAGIDAETFSTERDFFKTVTDPNSFKEFVKTAKDLGKQALTKEDKARTLKLQKGLTNLDKEIKNANRQRATAIDSKPTGASNEISRVSAGPTAKGVSGPVGSSMVVNTLTTGSSEKRARGESAPLEPEQISLRAQDAKTKLRKLDPESALIEELNDPLLNEDALIQIEDTINEMSGVALQQPATTQEQQPATTQEQQPATVLTDETGGRAGGESAALTFSSPEVKARIEELRTKIPSAKISEEQFTELAASFKADLARENVESDVLNPIDEVPSPNEPSKVTQYFKKIEGTLANLPAANSAIGTSLISKFSTLPNWLASLYVGFLSIPNKVELFGDKVLGLRELEAFLEEKAFIIKQQRERIGQVIEYVESIQKKYKQTPKGKATLKEWNKVLLELSRNNVDPTKILADPEGITKLKITDPKAAPFVERYDRLPKDLKEAAELIVEDLKLRYDTLRQVMMEAYPEAAESIAKDFQMLEYYLPMVRKGDHWFSYTTKDGEEGKAAETSPFLREKRKEQLRQEGATEFQDMDKAEVANLQTKPPAELIQKILSRIETVTIKDKKGKDKKLSNLDENAKEAVKKAIEEEYLALFPEQALRNQQQHRKGVPGYIEDVLFAYADTAPKVAASIANATFNKEIINKANEIETYASINFTKQPLLRAIGTDTIKSVPFYINPVASPFSSMAAYMSYVWFIGFNVSSSFVNLTQTPLVIQPFLAGEYGDAKATKALTKAYQLYFKGNGREHKRMVMGVNLADKTAGPYTLDLKTGKKTFTGPNAKLFKEGGRYAKLFDSAEKSAALRRGLSYEITELKRDLGQGLVTEGRLQAKTENVMNFLFQNSERLNRETALIAAFDLAKDAGKSDEVAIQEAIELTHKAHSHALPEVGPRFFQTGWPKVMFIFKRFAQSQVYLASKLFFDVFDRKAKTPQELEAKRTAKKQLLRLYANSILAAGIQGAPFYGLVSVLVSLLVDDDDDPITLDQWVNQTAGDVAYRGPLSYILGADVSQRIGFGDLIFRENAARLEKVGAFTYAVETLGGPAYSVGRRAVEGAGDVIDGSYLRGLEKMIPTAFGNTLKTFRYATQGVRNRNGTPIVEDQSAYEAFMQIMGFTNIEISEAYTRANALKRPERILTQRRAALLQKLYLADVLGDREGVKDIEEEIKEYNKKAPRSFKITNDTKQRSKRTKESRFKNSVDGVYIPKKYLKDLEDQYSLDED